MKRAMTVMVLGLTAGCGSQPIEQQEDESPGVAAASTASTPLTCSQLEVTRGSIGAGQTARALATRELSGTQDVWTSYVEFNPGTAAICSFPLPSGTRAEDVKGLVLRTNYRGPSSAHMRWMFQAYDAQAGKWVEAGDNAFASSWVWSATTLTVPGTPSSYIRDGMVRIHFLTHSTSDTALLDELTLVANVDSAPAPTPTPTPTPAPAPSGSVITYQYSASSDNFLNPERGFYDHVDLVNGRDYSHVRARERTLAYAGVKIGAYRNSALPTSFLQSLEAGFESARRAGIKVILRFVYNESMGEPDASKDRVLQHLQQLTPTLVRNADVIAVMQAGFIGAWGEWHSSSSGLSTPANRGDILRAILQALPASRMVQVRTPGFKDETLGGPLSENEAFSGTGASRVGHHNDCFLAGETDEGTYPSSSIERWKNFVAQEGRFTPVGGETCEVSAPRSDCPTTTAEMARLHWTYANAYYHPDVLARWSSQGCMQDIQRRLGYRFELVSASLGTSVRPGGTLSFEAQLRNTGYAAMFNERPVYLVLEGPGGRHELRLTGADPRRWAPGLDIRLRERLQLPATLAPGTYRVSLWLPDAVASLRQRPEYAVRFANQNVWMADSGLNVLTNVLVVNP